MLITKNTNPYCVEFVALWSAGDIAERIGKDKKKVMNKGKKNHGLKDL